MNNTQKQIKNNFNQININTLSHPISLIYMNIRSLRLHFASFLISINKIIDKIKLIILVETNITDSENMFYTVRGFNAIFYNRENRGGGIAIYIAEQINYNEISLHTNSTEMLQIDINAQHNKIISLLSIYRPPHLNISSFINELDVIVNKIKSKQDVILVGDINIDILRENTTTTTNYLNMLMSNGYQCIYQITTLFIFMLTKKY